MFYQNSKNPKVAILIDGDNIASKYAEYIKTEAMKYGDVMICRLYGTINNPTVKSWYKTMPAQAILPMLQISYTHGKSIADQALTIDAMDILYSGDIDVFCIVSSDSDFTKLVYRLKEAGNRVIGMGEQKTREALARACDEFKLLDLIYKDMIEEKQQDEENTGKGKKKKGKKEGAEEFSDASDEEDIMDEEDLEEEESGVSVPEVEKIIEDVINIIDTEYADDVKVNLAKIGKSLSSRRPGFDPRNYGCKNMNELLCKYSNLLKVTREKAKDGFHSIVYVSKAKGT